MEQMPTPTKLSPYPNSWYATKNASNLKPLQIINKKIAGKEFVLFPTASAAVYFPHFEYTLQAKRLFVLFAVFFKGNFYENIMQHTATNNSYF
ncbi:hypothetical protein BH10BAC1_BH10BAC1_18830 [soil metagenome]